MSLIEVKGLYKKYGKKEVLKDINISVKNGEVFAIIGPTGAGKTTLLYLLNMLDLPTSGRIYFEGEDVFASAKLRLKIRRRMAFVLQKPVVFNMSIYDNIAYGLRLRGMENSVIRKKVDDVLRMVTLFDYKERNARTLSGGETQRVAIARAIVTEPEVLLLDEPTANLDPLSIAKTENLIADIMQRYTMTIVMATHDMAYGQRFADRVCVFMNGEIQQLGSTGEVFAFPESKRVAEFVGVENIIEGTVVSARDGVVTVDIGEGRSIRAVSSYLVGTEAFVCLRSEDVVICPTESSDGETSVVINEDKENLFAGKVTRIVKTGAFIRAEVNCGFPLVASTTRRLAEETGLKEGRPVSVSFKDSAPHLIGRR